MTKLVVFTGVKCPKCPAARQICQEVAIEMNLEFQELNVQENLIEALQHQIASTPSIMIGDQVIFRSEVPSKEDLIQAIEKI